MATFTTGKGSIFDSGAETLVNPVNCRGTMGKGLALQFARRYPELERAYRKACAEGLVTPGSATMLKTKDGLTVANIATKDHWRNPSRLAWVKNGLASMARQMQEKTLTSVAVPALGAGLGGLPWPEVERTIHQTLESTGLTVIIYPPQGGKRSR